MSLRNRLPLALAAVLTLVSGCKGDEGEPDTHGTIHIELDGDSEATFSGTKRITANITYGASCLGEFYAANSNWAFDGPDGGPEFEKWAPRLCDSGEFDKLVECEVISMEQIAAGDSLKLVVHYEVTGGELYLHEVRVGPIPNEATAGCYPTMRIDSGSIAGYDDLDPLSGGQVWHIESYDSDTVSVNEGAPVTIKAVRN